MCTSEGGDAHLSIHDGEVCYITSEVTRNVTSEKPLRVSYKWLQWVTNGLHVPHVSYMYHQLILPEIR